MNIKKLLNQFLKATAEEESEEAKIYREAKQKVEDKKDVFRHIMVFIPVMLLLAFISIYVTPGAWWWFLIPLTIWSIALGFHYVDAFGAPRWWFFGEHWEKRELEKEFYRIQFEREWERRLSKSRAMQDKTEADHLDLEEIDFEALREELDEEDYV